MIARVRREPVECSVGGCAGGFVVTRPRPSALLAEVFARPGKVEGAPYGLDLERLLDAPLGELDVTRVLALGSFLASVHVMKATGPTLYERRVRELVGHGGGLMGVLDSYADAHTILPPPECEELERRAVSWRWRLRGRGHRLSRTHGDFHPRNVLFRTRADFSVLHGSWGEWGEPADDVAALAIAYLLFGLRASAHRGRGGTSEPFLDLFRIFLDGYLCESKDWELLEVLPPFLAFRALLVAHPGGPPALDESGRRALIELAAALLEPAPFDHTTVSRLFGEAS
ncbi:MAG TPA: phosphotransferase [Candidatus Limnocylindrales bacterium]|nr:phosphotransferase [Candidatus Limnocylindrales bacterium]